MSQNTQWSLTSGTVKAITQTPTEACCCSDQAIQEGHSDWFPEQLGNLLQKTERWCDCLSLGPPDGKFLQAFHDALKRLHEKNKVIKVRMMFGNVVGSPVNCQAVIERLTQGIPRENTKLYLWVGSWRKHFSWNHSKILAIDGKYLWTGGHNFLDQDYLQTDPVRDLSLHLQGPIAHDGHVYANHPWRFVISTMRELCKSCVNTLAINIRVDVRAFPPGRTSEFPPMYIRPSSSRQKNPSSGTEATVPILSIGRYGALSRFRIRPSDDAIFALLSSAKTVIRLAIQDLGPMTIPNTKIALPGTVWPKAYLSALAKALWKTNAQVEIILSNPLSVPGGLTIRDTFYGNGWSCVDVAAEILKAIRRNYKQVDDEALRLKFQNLRLCFLRGGKSKSRLWKNGSSMGLHSKVFIIDDLCYYTGSQNLYPCDLAEWGVVIDSRVQTAKLLDAFWNPMWTSSYSPEDCGVSDVVDGLEVDRDGEDPAHMSMDTKNLMESAELRPGDMKQNCRCNRPTNTDLYMHAEGEEEVEAMKSGMFDRRSSLFHPKMW